jgi:mono/diheme cytochrome c family protein
MKFTALAGMALMLLMVAPAQAAAINGKALFAHNCAACHGDNGQGGTGDVKGPKLVGDATSWSLKLFRRAVLEGKDDEGKAPTPTEVTAIYRYLRKLK